MVFLWFSHQKPSISSNQIAAPRQDPSVIRGYWQPVSVAQGASAAPVAQIIEWDGSRSDDLWQNEQMALDLKMLG